MAMLSDFSLFLNMDERQLPKFSFLSFREKLGQNKKNVTAFGALLVIVSLLLGSTVFFMNSRIATLVQLTGFTALGYMHVSIMQGNLAVLEPAEKLVYSLLLAACAFIFLSAFYLFTDNYPLLLIVAACCAFLLVYVLGELWRLYYQISESNVIPWYYTGELSSQQATVFLNSIPIQVKIQIEQHGRVEYPIAFRAPVKMKLGTIFYHMIKEQNESGKIPVDFIDRNNKPFGWVFFTPSFTGWTKALDPEATLIESKINPNAVIIARRIPEYSLTAASARQIQNA
jgi:hypothetical protein